MTKDEKIKELLAMLDMPEEEKLRFLDGLDNPVIDGQKILLGCAWRLQGDILANLAFRLRDEAGVIGNMHKGIKIVCKKLSPPNRTFLEWWTYEAKPIHWIIASLIAKTLAEEK